MNYTGPILLADDEPHIRKFVGLILKQLGCGTIIEAGNGEEAVALFEKRKPALVLLDVNMPIMDGIEALKKIKEIDPDCVAIMLTSLSNRGTIEAAVALGAANYIRKDTPKDEIARALTETINACFEPDTDEEAPAADAPSSNPSTP